MGLIERWKAPTPKFWKGVSNTAGVLAAGAIALMGIDAAGKLIVPNFSYTLHPITLVVCKNTFAFGTAIWAAARFAKQNIKDDDKIP